MSEFLGFLPCALWFIGTKMTGDKRTAGWVVLFASEFAWAALAIHTRIWSPLFWSVVGLGLYARNYRKWTREEARA